MTAPPGLKLFPGAIDRAMQIALIEAVFEAAKAAPFYTPRMPRSGAPMSVRQTNLGPLGWVTDQALGYRYESRHPETGCAWPPMPAALLGLWARYADYPAPPEACLINWYQGAARMGPHVDADEEAQDAPVLTVSLGAPARFRIGGPGRRDPMHALTLHSGDVLALGGASRRCFHGVDRLVGGSDLIPDGGRLSLTLRRVTRLDAEMVGSARAAG